MWAELSTHQLPHAALLHESITPHPTTYCQSVAVAEPQPDCAGPPATNGERRSHAWRRPRHCSPRLRHLAAACGGGCRGRSCGSSRGSGCCGSAHGGGGGSGRWGGGGEVKGDCGAARAAAGGSVLVCLLDSGILLLECFSMPCQALMAAVAHPYCLWPLAAQVSPHVYVCLLPHTGGVSAAPAAKHGSAAARCRRQPAGSRWWLAARGRQCRGRGAPAAVQRCLARRRPRRGLRIQRPRRCSEPCLLRGQRARAPHLENPQPRQQRPEPATW